MIKFPRGVLATLNDWEIHCSDIQRLDNGFKITTRTNIAATYTWAWLTKPVIIRKPLSDFAGTKVACKIIVDTVDHSFNFDFNGIVTCVENISTIDSHYDLGSPHMVNWSVDICTIIVSHSTRRIYECNYCHKQFENFGKTSYCKHCNSENIELMEVILLDNF